MIRRTENCDQSTSIPHRSVMQRIAQRPEIAVGTVAALWYAYNEELCRGKLSVPVRSPAVTNTATADVMLSKSDWRLIDQRYFAAAIPKVSCEERKTDTFDSEIQSLSWWRRTLAATRLVSLPLPRRLVRGDPAFEDGAFRRGLQRRRRDEEALRALQSEAVQARNSRDPERIQAVFRKISAIAYGKGVTPQMREDFVVRHGCTGWTEDVLDTLVDLAKNRGIVELGAGHGQWARALASHFQTRISQDERRQAFDFVLAFDDMTDLPLSTQIYHQHTQPANDYFYSKVQKCTDIGTVLRQWSCRGRLLLLVYPPPGPMALDAVKAYVDLGPENDTVVFVGEGRGGANAEASLFDYFESGDWVLTHVLPVQPPPGGKGYEKMFILRRSKVHSPCESEIR